MSTAKWSTLTVSQNSPRICTDWWGSWGYHVYKPRSAGTCLPPRPTRWWAGLRLDQPGESLSHYNTNKSLNTKQQHKILSIKFLLFLSDFFMNVCQYLINFKIVWFSKPHKILWNFTICILKFIFIYLPFNIPAS